MIENYELENFLRTEIPGISLITGKDMFYSPKFIVHVFRKTDHGVHFSINIEGIWAHLDFLVKGNRLIQLFTDDIDVGLLTTKEQFGDVDKIIPPEKGKGI